MVCDDEKAALKRESKNSESSKFSDGSRIETFAWPRREVGREQAKGETPSSSISSNKKCLARNAEKDERNSLEPARETLRPGDLRPEQRGNHGGGALECVQENPIKTIVRLVYACRDLQQQGLHHCYGEASSRRPHCLNLILGPFSPSSSIAHNPEPALSPRPPKQMAQWHNLAQTHPSTSKPLSDQSHAL